MRPGGVLVISGDICGLTLVLLLHRRDVRVRVYEAYRELVSNAGTLLQLVPNALAALQQNAPLERAGVLN